MVCFNLINYLMKSRLCRGNEWDHSSFNIASTKEDNEDTDISGGELHDEFCSYYQQWLWHWYHQWTWSNKFLFEMNLATFFRSMTRALFMSRKHWRESLWYWKERFWIINIYPLITVVSDENIHSVEIHFETCFANASF